MPGPNCPYLASFGAADASFWKRRSFRSGSNIGSSRSSAGMSGGICPKVLALLFRREGSDPPSPSGCGTTARLLRDRLLRGKRLNDFLKAPIAAKRVPEGQQL